jgi:hypothetical protein
MRHGADAGRRSAIGLRAARPPVRQVDAVGDVADALLGQAPAVPRARRHGARWHDEPLGARQDGATQPVAPTQPCQALLGRHHLLVVHERHADEPGRHRAEQCAPVVGQHEVWRAVAQGGDEVLELAPTRGRSPHRVHRHVGRRAGSRADAAVGGQHRVLKRSAERAHHLDRSHLRAACVEGGEHVAKAQRPLCGVTRHGDARSRSAGASGCRSCTCRSGTSARSRRAPLGSASR